MRAILNIAASLLLLILAAPALRAADSFPQIRGPAQPDTVFLQEVPHQIPHAAPVTAVGGLPGSVFAGTEKGLYQIQGSSLVEVAAVREPVRRIIPLGEDVWCLTAGGLHLLSQGAWRKLTGEPVSDVCLHLGKVHAAIGAKVAVFEGGQFKQIGTNVCEFAISRLVSHQDAIYVQGGNRACTFVGGVFGGFDYYGFPADVLADWGTLPSRTVRDFIRMDSRLFFATDRGLGVLRGMVMTTLKGEQGLPFEDALCLAGGFDGELWVGTSRGVARYNGSKFYYYAGQRWIPSERVNAIAVIGRTAWLATDGGLGVIEFEPYTLAKKAAYYEKHLEEWGQKRLGFVQKLEWDADLKEFVREAGDNDGGYSGDYLTAESYRFAVTRDPAARKEATNTFYGLRWLRTMTTIPGFPARAVWLKNEKGHRSTGGSGGYPAEWHDSPGGDFQWKADTSSDELCSHFYATARFIELAAQGDEVKHAKEHLASIASHLIDHGWQLIDLDGKPTRWGRWDPDYFKTDEGHFDRALQCVEILSFMKTAEVLTGDPKFAAAYKKLVDLGYHQMTLRQRHIMPPESISHFEDQLAFWSYWNLIRFEQNPDLRALYRRSFERSYELVRVEQQPWQNMVHHAISGDSGEDTASLNHLREWPLDLRVWSYQNSHRADLRTPPGYQAFMESPRPFSASEREPMRWDAWTMQADGGAGGKDVVEPSSWLLAYWMARYYGALAAPTTTDPTLLTVEHSLNHELGAKPYDGPPRPFIP